METAESKKKILVIDDDEIHLSMAQAILSKMYDVIIAKTGKEAITLLLDGVIPCLILLDIIMPHMDGWETYNKLKGLSLLKDCPIVFVTSLDGADDRENARRLGAAGYITKPFETEDFLDKVNNIIANSTFEC